MASYKTTSFWRYLISFFSINVFTLSLVGFPLVALLISATELESRVATLPFRVCIVLMGLIVVFDAFLKGHVRRPNVFVLFFLFVYSLRLLWDFNVAKFVGAEDALVFLTMTTIVPLCVLWCTDFLYLENEFLIAKSLIVISTAGCFFTIIIDYFGWAGLNSLTEETGRLSFNALNPITIGHLAVTNIIACIFMFDKPWGKYRFTLIAIIMLSLGCLVLSASRGPLVSLAICIAFFCWKTNRKKLLIAVVAAVIPLIGVAMHFYLRGQVASEDVTISEDLSYLERIGSQTRAIEQTLDHSILGSAYVEFVTMEYPHNFFIEVFMSLGLVGLLLITILMLNLSYGWWVSLKRKRILVLMLFLQYFIAIQFSGAIWNSPAFWLTTALLLTRRHSVEQKMPQDYASEFR